MERKNLYLTLGIVLSIGSKWLQFQHGSIWGDIMILLAAIFFVLAILLYIPQYQTFLNDPKRKSSARALAIYACSAVVSFQLFTMATFGWGYNWGFILLLPFFLFTGLCLFQWMILSNSGNRR